MRPIDADALKDYIDAQEGRPFIGCTVGEALKIITDEQPTIQPDIVRCKDCKHRDPEDKKCDCGHDILWQLPRRDDWYCADAERREVTT